VVRKIRKIFGRMRDEIAEQFRISHNEELCDFHRSISIVGIGVVQSV
jgi:hypothetical protein